MSDPRTPPAAPPTGKTPAANGSSRTVVIAVVVLLIVVAIAGIVLAGKKPAGDAAATAPTPAASAAAVAPVASATPEAASAPTASAPDELMFLAGSDRLPPGAAEKIAEFVQEARKSGKSVRVTVRFLTGANKAKDSALAKARADAVHHAVMSNGLTGDKTQVELVEMPAGALTPRDADRAVLSLR